MTGQRGPFRRVVHYGGPTTKLYARRWWAELECGHRLERLTYEAAARDRKHCPRCLETGADG